MRALYLVGFLCGGLLSSDHVLLSGGLMYVRGVFVFGSMGWYYYVSLCECVDLVIHG